MKLKEEIQTFENMKGELLKHHKGKYALIKGKEFIGAFDTKEYAFYAGVNKFGASEFLIKQISEQDKIESAPALMHGLINAHL